MSKIIVICGPTASGKTDLGHNLALHYGGEIINCDSMQVYCNMVNITASPSLKLRQEASYHLYNFWSTDKLFSVAQYAELASAKVKEILSRNKLPILVGGTGMYVNALLNGYNNIPNISDEVRNYTRDLHDKIGQQEFFILLKQIDSATCSKINPNDVQRSLRAFEVFKETGRSITSYHHLHTNIHPLKGYDFKTFFILPERKFLYDICNKRLIDMFSSETMEEIKYLKNRVLDPKMPAAGAIGVREIISYLDNLISFDEAIIQAQARTRQYAKRQITWFRHQLQVKNTLEYHNIITYNNLISKIQRLFEYS